ncbi:MAG: hypothetical protein ACO2PP_03100, partial [Thermocrinis sp.]|uniref:hypothetical protein n=1 Tax=Thermocrinis sp. TaxID=2024383 RepID=UPI003C0044E1
MEGRTVEEILQKIKTLLQQEDIPFNEIMNLLLLAISLMKHELHSLLGIEEKLKEPQKREKPQPTETQEEEPIQEENLPCVHFVRVGRPAGSKDTAPRMTLREFFEKEIIPLHKERNWEEKAKEVRERILRGEFVIASLEDFIGYLYAYMLFEDVPAYLPSSSAS